jgi:hypothetical protein
MTKTSYHAYAFAWTGKSKIFVKPSRFYEKTTLIMETCVRLAIERNTRFFFRNLTRQKFLLLGLAAIWEMQAYIKVRFAGLVSCDWV